MATNLKGLGSMIKLKAKEKRFGLMDLRMWGHSLEERKMEQEYSKCLIIVYMKVNLRIMRCMVMVS
jgi:hypothetical protein